MKFFEKLVVDGINYELEIDSSNKNVVLYKVRPDNLHMDLVANLTPEGVKALLIALERASQAAQALNQMVEAEQ